ncbi:hypothetical protein C8Q74DRAFT_1215674 [Fomes fomentarius]|nr:hypothetical protein C8Q74DRAFT_1215674 [Fomes fomentarius]
MTYLIPNPRQWRRQAPYDPTVDGLERHFEVIELHHGSRAMSRLFPLMQRPTSRDAPPTRYPLCCKWYPCDSHRQPPGNYYDEPYGKPGKESGQANDWALADNLWTLCASPAEPNSRLLATTGVEYSAGIVAFVHDQAAVGTGPAVKERIPPVGKQPALLPGAMSRRPGGIRSYARQLRLG